MDVENDIRASVFCVDPLQSAEEPPSIDPGLLVFHSPLIADPYYLARWDQQPEVLLFLFKDYSVQDRYLKRLAFLLKRWDLLEAWRKTARSRASMAGMLMIIEQRTWRGFLMQPLPRISRYRMRN